MTHVAGIDYAVMGLYSAFVLGIGVLLRRSVRTSEDFFLSGRAIPAWVTGLAFLSANLGAQEVIGMGASGAKYGIATSHFYWIGAIPAMVFIGLFMMPFYYGSRARSVPEYLKLRFDEKTRALNAVSFATMTVFSSGISLYAMGKLLHLLLGWSFDASILVAAGVVLAYIFLGGLTSAIYNEVLQFFLIVFGFAPLVFLGLRAVGGWPGLSARLATVAAANGYAPGAYTRSWAFMGHAAHNPVGVEWFGLVMGLGFVLSFGYWCTDFLVVQRAMAANSMTAARRTPLIAALPKMLFPFLVIFPGMIALVVTPPATSRAPSAQVAPAPGAAVTVTATATAAAAAPAGVVPPKLDPRTGAPLRDARGRVVLDYDLATPMLLLNFFPAGLLGLGLTALLASFMSGMAGNVTAFNTVWTYDLYQSYVRPGRALPRDGPHRHGRGHRDLNRRGVRRRLIQQHHGLPAARVRVRERAIVRHLRARHVLEARDGPRRVRGARRRDARRRRAPRALPARGRERRREGWLPRRSCHFPQRAGPDVLDGHRRLGHLLSRDHPGVPRDPAEAGGGARWTGLRAD